MKKRLRRDQRVLIPGYIVERKAGYYDVELRYGWWPVVRVPYGHISRAAPASRKRKVVI